MICPLVLVFALWNNIMPIVDQEKDNKIGVLNNSLFTVSVYAMETDGSYVEKVLFPDILEDVPLISLTDISNVVVFSLKEFEEKEERYYFDIYDEKTNEDIDFQLDSIKFKGEDGTSNLIIDPNTIIIHPKEGLIRIILDVYNFNNELAESMLLKIEETDDNYKVKIIEHDKMARANNKDNISVIKGGAIFVKEGIFEVAYENEFNYKKFSEIKPIEDKYTKETPYNDKWGKDQITYIDYALNRSEFTAQGDIPFSADIYTSNGDMVASVKSINEKDNYIVNIKIPNRRYYIMLLGKDGKLTENGGYNIWK